VEKERSQRLDENEEVMRVAMENIVQIDRVDQPTITGVVWYG
jgi:hypothetical protein